MDFENDEEDEYETATAGVECVGILGRTSSIPRVFDVARFYYEPKFPVFWVLKLPEKFVASIVYESEQVADYGKCENELVFESQKTTNFDVPILTILQIVINAWTMFFTFHKDKDCTRIHNTFSRDIMSL